MTMQNQAIETMLNAGRERLQGRQPEDISQKASIPFDAAQSAFLLTSLGSTTPVSYPAYEFSPTLDKWQQIIALHYMHMADATPRSQEWIRMNQLKDGTVRGGGFDRDCDNLVRTRLGLVAPDRLAEICRNLGAELISSNADLCAVFSFLPEYPMMLKIWFADDELPASGRMLINENAGHYLTIEDAVVAGNLILEKITQQIDA